MPVHGAPPPTVYPSKRQRQDSSDVATTRKEQMALSTQSRAEEAPSSPSGEVGSLGKKSAAQSNNFRNVSACNRCRLRKNRCDQKLPSCASCSKARVPCVGYDPITKREIPRSYVFYLETRAQQLESLLSLHNIEFPPADSLESCLQPGLGAVRVSPQPDEGGLARRDGTEGPPTNPQPHPLKDLRLKKPRTTSDPNRVAGASQPRSLASTSGVSFARVVFAAVQYSVSDQRTLAEKPAPIRTSEGGRTSMRDSFFGLHTKPTINPAPFPDKSTATGLVTLYFEHANPQIPILHRGEFMRVFELAFSKPWHDLGSRELYMLNMVFAIGSGVIVGEPVKTEPSDDNMMALDGSGSRGSSQPEEYHASAIVHLEACLSSGGGGLDVLQAVLLLANFALLRPVPPGLWYIVGVAVRLAVDLGLHYEEGGDVDPSSASDSWPERGQPRSADGRNTSGQERGRRLYTRDLRRRLWWCTYSFDRLVGTCVGRPFGISDQAVTTELPSLLDDDYITPAGFEEPVGGQDSSASYKNVAHHYFRLRLLQSEIMQVLQYNQAQLIRAGGNRLAYPEMRDNLPCPYLVHYDSYRSWRIDIDGRLLQWQNSAPTRDDTGVMFSTEFLELNYWQAIILLYRQSLSVPALFQGEYNTLHEVNSPAAYTAELREDEDHIYLKVAEAGQKILRIYRQLHLSGLVSYTYLSTHHLFMAGISYLYAIWHSPTVRHQLVKSPA